MCAIAICQMEPLALNSRAKNSSRLMPMTISGVTIGSRISGVGAPAAARLARGGPGPGPAASRARS